MEPVSIEYRIKLGPQKTEVLLFELDGKTFDLIPKKVSSAPKWAKLTFQQCSHCPLNAEVHEYCPVALQLHDIVERFHATKSIDMVELEVITEERRVIQTLDIQRAISSILDLVMPICGCPKTTYMKPMARFHLPLASEEETVFRVTGMYLLSQYFVSQTSRGAGIQFEGLTKIYEDLHILNAAVASRLKAATTSDSVKNAITLVDMYSMLVPVLLEDQLVEMRGFFEAYLPEIATEEKPVTTTKLEQAKAFRLELVPLDDDSPEWLKAVLKSQNGDEPEQTEESEKKELEEEERRKQEAIEAILGKSSLNLTLEPLADPEDTSEEQESKPSSSGKAVFKLDD